MLMYNIRNQKFRRFSFRYRQLHLLNSYKLKIEQARFYAFYCLLALASKNVNFENVLRNYQAPRTFEPPRTSQLLLPEKCSSRNDFSGHVSTYPSRNLEQNFESSQPIYDIGTVDVTRTSFDSYPVENVHRDIFVPVQPPSTLEVQNFKNIDLLEEWTNQQTQVHYQEEIVTQIEKNQILDNSVLEISDSVSKFALNSVQELSSIQN